MPFKSEKQRRYMHANLPDIAKRWEKDYASGGIARLGFANGNLAYARQQMTMPQNYIPAGARIATPYQNVDPSMVNFLNYVPNRGLNTRVSLPQFLGTGDLGNPTNDSRIPSEKFESEIPMGTDIYGMNEMFSYPRIKPDYNFGRDIDQTYMEGDFNVSPKQPAWYNRMFNKAGQGITGLKNQMGNIFSGARNKGGALVGNIMGMAMGIPGLGALLGNMRPDNPYEKFQKQMFAEMGYQGDPNKDPFGKNVRSLFGEYDVREQFDKLAGSKIGQKYGYEEAMKDGVLTDEELEAMQDIDPVTGKPRGLKGWQLNRFKTLFEAKKRADAYHKNIRDAVAKKEADREARKRDQANIRKIEQHTGQRMSDYRRSRPASERQFTGAAPKGTTTFDTKSGMGRRDYVQGGLASLWPK